MFTFLDRKEAGKELAKKLLPYYQQKNTLILALPRGGVPVAHEIAKVLHLPLDVFIVRKLGAPFNEEFALGAIASGGALYLDAEVVRDLGVAPHKINEILEKEQKELERRNTLYRDGRSFPDVTGKTIILIDDGIATGSTVKAAIMALNQHTPQAIILAVPVGPPSIFKEFKDLVHKVICLEVPSYFEAVGQAYKKFPQITDEEVLDLLKQPNDFN